MALDKDHLWALLAQGKTDQEIGEELGKTASTINYHRRGWIKAGSPGLVSPTVEDEPVLTTSLGEATALLAAGQPELAPTTEQVEAQPPAHAPENLPVIGNIYEGIVDKVDPTFALVNILEFHDKESGKWIRGKVKHYRVLRHGVCKDISKWLTPGDHVNVKVLAIEEGPGTGLARWRVDLSIREAPRHPNERILLEVGSPRARDEEPDEPLVSARGSEVAAQLQMKPPAVESFKLKGPPGPDPDFTNRELDRLRHQLQHLQGELDTTKSDLAAAEHQRACLQTSTRRLGEELSATKEALRQAHETVNDIGVCATCVHHVDGFCPYPHLLLDTYPVPDEDLSERHKGKRIVRGRRPVVECELHRPVQ